MEVLGNTLIAIFIIAWLGSGYIGATWLMGKGYVLELAGCAILAGGLPILLPAVMGPLFFLIALALPAKEHSIAGRIEKSKQSNRQLDIDVVGVRTEPPIINITPSVPSPQTLDNPNINIKDNHALEDKQNMHISSPHSLPSTYSSHPDSTSKSKKCPHCNYVIRSKAKFCSNCGQSTSVVAVFPSPKSIVQSICSNCSVSIRPQAKFCGNCGFKQKSK